MDEEPGQSRAVIVVHVARRGGAVIATGREFPELQVADFRGIVWESRIGADAGDRIRRCFVKEEVRANVAGDLRLDILRTDALPNLTRGVGNSGFKLLHRLSQTRARLFSFTL